MKTHHAKLSLAALFAIVGSPLFTISSPSAADYTSGGDIILSNGGVNADYGI